LTFGGGYWLSPLLDAPTIELPSPKGSPRDMMRLGEGRASHDMRVLVLAGGITSTSWHMPDSKAVRRVERGRVAGEPGLNELLAWRRPKWQNRNLNGGRQAARKSTYLSVAADCSQSTATLG
jgi:hypothetical protein